MKKAARGAFSLISCFLDCLYSQILKMATNIKAKYSENEIVRRAYSRIGEKGYYLIFNNCEHFARWCIPNGSSFQYLFNNCPIHFLGAHLAFVVGSKQERRDFKFLAGIIC